MKKASTVGLGITGLDLKGTFVCCEEDPSVATSVILLEMLFHFIYSLGP